MSIEYKLLQYKDVLNQIEKRRNKWTNETKPFIFTVLTQVTKQINYLWEAAKNESYENYQNVYLKLHTVPSGISKFEGNGGKHFVKTGGAILFSQTYNGNISIIYEYPVVEYWQSNRERRVMETVSPDVINESFILNHVEQFIDQMGGWENNRHTIIQGFNRIDSEGKEYYMDRNN